MKQYKLIKEYPGSPALYSIYEKIKGACMPEGLYKNIEKDNQYIPPSNIENYPDFWEEIVKTLLFTTNDGVDIFEGDNLHWVCDEFTYFYTQNVSNTHYNLIDNGKKGVFKIFATEIAAKEYIRKNKKYFSLNDIKKIINDLGPTYGPLGLLSKLNNLIDEKLK